ncbi:alpha/beta hydrolase [Streptomyces sp. NBC_01235]|uniref:alpha/beta hydrolase n=1 Tax=Streptomyces sp. NBC_01235 TaxID=2903788 RepID=UPI002E0E9601|nr:alpha/beta hydrolase [Streptomyces sp. NBC_01235]
MEKPHLLFIPGLGDRAWLYHLAAPLWRLLGYVPHVYCFGWTGDASQLQEKQRALLVYVNTLPSGLLYVVGMSAGGTSAVNLLIERPDIRRVVTVASPLKPKDHPTNPLLEASIAQADNHLSNGDEMLLSKVVSVHGVHDWRVPVGKSQRPDIQSVQLPTLGHGATIFFAVTVFALKLRQLLRSAPTTE